MKVRARYPHDNRKPLTDATGSVSTLVTAEEVVFRVSDDDNIDFWLEIRATPQELEDLLTEVQEAIDNV